jgi:glycosyltransferase involved in cell wall biosynthesis
MTGPESPRVAAIVPAYNEQVTLADVLAALRSVPAVGEILVVSDGSTDRTVEVARGMGVKAIHLRENHGKGRAMAVGVAHTAAEYLLFVDGDILNLTRGMLEGLLEPVLAGHSEMNVGIRNRGNFINSIHGELVPLLSGIRAMRRHVFEAVPEDHIEGFAIETELNWVCRERGYRVTTTVLHHLKHLVKEKKRGFVRGFIARFDMFWVVLTAYLSLRWQRPGLRRPPARAGVQAELDYINF